MSRQHYATTGSAVVTLRMTTGTAPSGTALEHRWEATVYVLDSTGPRADIVDAIPLSGTVRPRTAPVTADMLHSAARKQVRAALEDLTGRDHAEDPISIKWRSISTLAKYRSISVEDACGIREAEAAWFWSIVGTEPEDIPRDRSTPAVGLVDLTTGPVRGAR